MRIYQPSNSVTPAGIVVLSIFAIIGGILLGMCMAAVDRGIVAAGAVRMTKLLFLLALLTAMAAGVAGGLILKTGIKLGKIHFSAMAYVGGSVCTLAAAITAVMTYLHGTTDVSGWIMIGGGVICIAIGAIWFPESNTREPFCMKCDQWFTKEQRLGEYPYVERRRLVTLFTENNLPRAERLLPNPLEGGTSTLELAVRTCACRPKNSVLVFHEVRRTVDREGRTHTVKTLHLSLLVTAEEQAAVLAAISGKPAAAR